MVTLRSMNRKQLLLTVMVVVTSQVACYGLPLFQPRPDRNHRLLELSEARQGNIGLFRVLSQPTNTRNIRLWSRNRNVFLQVNANGVVNGTHESNNKYTILVQESLSVSIVRFKGFATKKYIAMDKKGRIYSTSFPNVECLFKTHQEENFYHTFWSYYYANGSRSWLISVKKNGKMRRGTRTRVGEKSTQFVVVPVNSNL
ncbi:fibroblast growth factor 1-like isoform X1 [Rhopilema esculentum]|uniref:fibroblast growth factor 1-like isoform X1 n=1 Tax=Rhopilema esculentum TaxID=499914 RepID=UPI0031DEF524